MQRYAIPGRVIETWVRIDRPGVYYGECNQICGMNHSRMPVVIHAVTEPQFQDWLKTAKTKYASNGTGNTAAVASAAGTLTVADGRN